MAKGELTPKRARFVEEYPIDSNATKAAERAGFSKKTAYSQGQRLLKNVDIQEALALDRAKTSARSEVTKDRITEEYRRIAFADLRELFTWDERKCVFVASGELTEEQAAAVSGVKSKTVVYTDKDGNTTNRLELELKTYDKLKALQDLSRHLGMFQDTRDAAVNITVVQIADRREGMIDTFAAIARRLVEINELAVEPAHTNGAATGNGAAGVSKGLLG